MAEQTLLAFARRASRPAAGLALALHLSRLAPPAPRPHHRRIARAMLIEAVQRHGGQLLEVAGGDLVLLCPAPVEAPATEGHDEDPGSLLAMPAFLVSLLRVDAPDPERLVSLWRLPAQAAGLLDYATARAVGPATATADAAAVPPAPADPAQPGLVDALSGALGLADVADVLQCRTAVQLPSRASLRGTVQPLFREISFAVAALEARVGAQVGGGRPARADPYLFRHLSARLDRRMLDALAEARGTPGPLGAALAVGPPLHLNLSLATLASPALARLAAIGFGSAGQAGGGVEVSLMEACADPAAFIEARQRLQALGLRLVLDRVSHLALGLAHLGPLQPDLVKLEWSPAMARLDSAEALRLDAALHGIGAERLLLLRADSEAAMLWGMERGIRRFQGRHVDAMLAAARLAACAHARGCTLRQCSERAAAASTAGRRFCRNTGLLDAVAPHPAQRLLEIA